MKNTLLFLCLSFIFWACHDSNNDKITITVDVENLPEVGVSISYMKSIQRSFEFDENKHGRFEIEGLDAVFLRVHNGFSEIMPLYAEKGDHIHLSFDGISMEKTLKIDGDRKKITEYLKNKEKLEDLPRETFLMEFSEFVEKIDQTLVTDLKEFESQKKALAKESKLFVKLEENDIIFDRYLDILHYPVIQQQVGKAPKAIFPEEYFVKLKSLMKEDSDLLSLYLYRSFMTGSAWKIATNGACPSSDEYSKYLSQVNYFVSNINDKQTREGFINILICEYTSQYGINKTFDEIYRNNVTSKKYNDEYAKIYESWVRVEPGEPMIAFTAFSPDGKTVTPNDFKGNYTLYYLWLPFYASTKEYQYLKELEPLFKEKNIKLVSLCIDSNKDSWEQAIQNPEIQLGEHYYLGFNREFLDACHYNSYNMYQFILVDDKGLIVSINLPFPSSGKFSSYIESKL